MLVRCFWRLTFDNVSPVPESDAGTYRGTGRGGQSIRGRSESARQPFRRPDRQGSVARMKDPLVRFGVAIEGSLLRQLDALADERACTRSELLRDLSRAAVGKAKVPKGVAAVGALTLVYDHHVRDLSNRLTNLQHELGDEVRAAMHVHLNDSLCLEVVVLRGQSDELQEIAERILAMRGVKQGGIEIIAGLPPAFEGQGHGHPRGHTHAHPHPHAVEAAPTRSRETRPRARASSRKR